MALNGVLWGIMRITSSSSVAIFTQQTLSWSLFCAFRSRDSDQYALILVSLEIRPKKVQSFI